MLVVRFYIALSELVTEGTYIPDFHVGYNGPRAGLFIGRYYTGGNGAVTCDDLTNSLHMLLKNSTEHDGHKHVEEWVGA